MRAVVAFKRGEPRVCAMAVPPTPEEEDRRRLSPRARRTLVAERVEHVNRIKGLLFSAEGISDYEPIEERDRRKQARAELRTGDGRCISHPSPSQRSRGNSTGWNCSSTSSKRWKRSATKLLAKPRADPIPSPGDLLLRLKNA